MAAAKIAADDGPTQGALASSVTTESKPLAAVPNSAASSSQAVAATIIDSDPGPAYIRPELISGGNAPKSNTVSSSVGRDRGGDLGCHIRTRVAVVTTW